MCCSGNEPLHDELLTGEQVIVRGNNSSTNSETDNEPDSDGDSQENRVVVEAIEETLCRAEDYTRLSEHILQLGDNLRFNVNHVTLLKSSLCLLSCDFSEKYSRDASGLENTLQVYKMETLQQDADHCPFYTFSYEIENYMEREMLNADEIQFWKSLNLIQNGSVDPAVLHRLVISELFENELEYASFRLTSKTAFEHEVSMLEADRNNCSNIVNCIPLAICNILRIQIVLFTGMLNAPVIPLSPKLTALFQQPIHIAYDHRQHNKFIRVVRRAPSTGDEKALVKEETESPLVTNTLQPCRCGKGASKGNESCTSIRCKCFANKQSCKGCRCGNCKNQYGKRELLKDGKPGKPIPRKRRHHETTSQSKTNLAYLMESDKDLLATSKWSIYEQIVLVELSRTLFSNETFDIDMLCSIVANINSYSVPHERTFTTRSKNEISKQVFYAIAVDNTYQKLLKEQLRMNST